MDTIRRQFVLIDKLSVKEYQYIIKYNLIKKVVFAFVT